MQVAFLSGSVNGSSDGVEPGGCDDGDVDDDDDDEEEEKRKKKKEEK